MGKTLFIAPFDDEDEERAWIEREQEINRQSAQAKRTPPENDTAG